MRTQFFWHLPPGKWLHGHMLKSKPNSVTVVIHVDTIDPALSEIDLARNRCGVQKPVLCPARGTEQCRQGNGSWGLRKPWARKRFTDSRKNWTHLGRGRRKLFVSQGDGPTSWAQASMGRPRFKPGSAWSPKHHWTQSQGCSPTSPDVSPSPTLQKQPPKWFVCQEYQWIWPETESPDAKHEQREEQKQSCEAYMCLFTVNKLQLSSVMMYPERSGHGHGQPFNLNKDNSQRQSSFCGIQVYGKYLNVCYLMDQNG